METKDFDSSIEKFDRRFEPSVFLRRATTNLGHSMVRSPEVDKQGTKGTNLNIESIHTFIELSRLGNFSRVAEQLNITQSTVSARVKVLEEHLGCQLFARKPGGVSLTSEGRKFYRYAASVYRLWQQGKEDIRKSQEYDGSIGLGVHLTMWRQFLPDWIVRMRKTYPNIAIRVEADYSERLTDYVREGVVDLAVTHMPHTLPGLTIELFRTDRLILVSSSPRRFADCRHEDYVHVDWSYGYREEHFEKLSGFQAPPVNIGFGEMAVEYLLKTSCFAYVSEAAVANRIEAGQLHVVEDAPELSRPSYLVALTEPNDPERIIVAVDALKAASANLSKS